MMYQEARHEQPCKPLPYRDDIEEEKRSDSIVSIAVEDRLDELFDEQVEVFYQNLELIYDPWTDGDAEAALERLYVALSVEDAKLSNDGRTLLKQLLVERGAMDVIVAAMKRNYTSPSFYRRACACLAYFIRGSQNRATLLLELDGLATVFQVMQHFNTSEVIQLYCVDLVGLILCNASYSQSILESSVEKFVPIMADLKKSGKNPNTYTKMCSALSTSFAKNPQVQQSTARHLSQISRDILFISQRQPAPKQQQHPEIDAAEEQEDSSVAMHPKHAKLLFACHDLLNAILGEAR